MQIVRTIAWVLLAVVLALFTVANWNPVEVVIWENLVLETKLPVLVLGAFMLGLLPMWVAHRVSLWRWQRRVTTIERTVSPYPADAPRPPARASSIAAPPTEA